MLNMANKANRINSLILLWLWYFIAAIPVHAAGNTNAQAGNSLIQITVLDFELRDLTLTKDNSAEIQRTKTLAPLLQDVLASEYGYGLVTIPLSEQLEADQGFGYLFDKPSAAAKLGETYGAEWIVVSRLHKPSFLFAYLISHVIHVPSGKQGPELVVEIKGQQQKLNLRGVRSLAKLIDQQIRATQTP